MTTVRVGLVRVGDGQFVGADGGVSFAPHVRYSTAPSEPTDVVLPLPVGVQVGSSVDLPGGAYRCVENVTGGIVRYVVIPGAGSVDYADLPSVDPATLEPVEADIPAWQEAVQATNAARMHVDDVGLLVHGVGETAEASAQAAEAFMATAAEHAGTALAAAARAEEAADDALETVHDFGGIIFVTAIKGETR